MYVELPRRVGSGYPRVLSGTLKKSGILCFRSVYYVFNAPRRAEMKVEEYTLSGKKSGRKILIFHDEDGVDAGS